MSADVSDMFDSDQDALRLLLGTTIPFAFCPGLHLCAERPDRLESEAFALAAARGVVVVSAPDWSSTLRFAINVFRLRAQYAERPPWREEGAHTVENGFSVPGVGFPGF
jgi:hypothetical protein